MLPLSKLTFDNLASTNERLELGQSCITHILQGDGYHDPTTLRRTNLLMPTFPTFSDHQLSVVFTALAIMLAALGIFITALGLAIGIAAVVGWKHLGEIVRTQAKEQVSQVLAERFREYPEPAAFKSLAADMKLIQQFHNQFIANAVPVSSTEPTGTISPSYPEEEQIDTHDEPPD
jgi:hypothetical protein